MIESGAGTIRIGECDIEVRSWPGQGLPIVLLHEGLGSVASWRDFPARLAAATGRRVLAWSRRGYGASTIPDAPFGIDYMHREADLIPATFAALGIDRAILYGHSDGGSIALIAASRSPDRVAALVLEAPHVLVEPVTVDSIARIAGMAASTDLVARLGRYHRDPQTTFTRWRDIWLDPAFLDWNLEPLLPGVAAPTLLIQGLNDEYGTLDQLDRIERVVDRTARVTVPKCGHSPHRERPEVVLAEVATFLASVKP